MGNSLLKKIWLLAVLLVSAQNIFSAGYSLVWQEDFGVVADSTRSDFADPNKSMPGHEYNGDIKTSVQDGQYAIVNSTSWSLYGSDEYFKVGRDHTGNKDGGMLVVNTKGELDQAVIYEQKIDFPLCGESVYKMKAYASSITSFESIKANLIFRVTAEDGTVLAEEITGDMDFWDSSVGGAYDDPTAMRNWTEFSLDFESGSHKSITIQVINNAFCTEDGRRYASFTAEEIQSGKNCGAGNDFALDDIMLLRYDDEKEAPEVVVSANTISSQGGSDCIFTSSYSIPKATLTAWKDIYKTIYVLWQESEDGYVWKNMTDASGEDAINMQAEVNIYKTMRYRVIVTGGKDLAQAKSVAEEIAANGGPSDGCWKYAISNTLAASKPVPDCTFSPNLKSLFDEDFGVLTEEEPTKEYSGTDYTYNKYSSAAGDYCVTYDPVVAKQNSWDGIESSTDADGNSFGGMLMAYVGPSSPNVIFEKTLTGPFCNCKTYMFSFQTKINQSWTGYNLIAAAVDEKGDTLGSLPLKYTGAGSPSAWTRYTVEFTPDMDYTGSVKLLILNNETPSSRMLFDNITVRVCGDLVPQDSIFINNDPSIKSLTGFDCTEKPSPTINLSDMSSWKKDYPNAAFVWQTSTDGGTTWTSLTSTSKSIDFESEEGGTVLYRAIVAEDATIAKNIANGTASDGCGVYLITNTVTLECSAQCHFNNDMLVLWKDDFGSVPAGTRKSCKNLQGHTLLTKMSESVNDGYYAVVSRMKDAGTWFAAMDGTDHTGNADGGFLLINVDPDYKGKVIYEQELGFTTCPETSYFFSLWAASISKRVATGASDGVLCNLRLEIIDKATNTVLASKETGDIPNAESLSGSIPWVNYGTSFTSAGESVILRIYDNAGNGKKGNDLVIDDISLIACEEAAPVVELAVDGEDDVTGVCNESEYTLAVGDLTGWNKIYGDDVYCLWQQSADGGETWKTLEDNSGNAAEYGNLKVTALRNMQKVEDSLVNVGYRYRVIVAGPKSEVTEQISKNGYPDNGCYLFRISNIMTVRCDCKEPEFKASTDTLFNICQSEDAITMSAKQTNTATLDTVRWFSKKPTDTDWTQEDEFIGEKIDATSLTKEVVPADSIQYLILGYSEACVSDSVIFTINVDKPIEIEDLVSTTLCAGSDTTYKAVVTSGYPLTYVWNGTEGKSDEYAITGITKDVDITLVAKGSVCESEEKTATVTAEAAVEIADKLEGAEVCAFTETSFDSKAVAKNIQWYQSYSGSTVFTPIASATEAVLTCSPDSNRTYKVVASGDKCPSKELSVDVTVTYPSVIEASIDKTEFCEGESATITVKLDHVTSLEWLKQEEGETSFSKFQTKTYSETETSTSETFSPTKTTKYLVQVPSNGCAAAQSEPMTVTVETPIDFSLSTSDTLICKGTEITLTSKLNAGTPATTTLTATTADGATDLTMEDGQLALTPEKTTTYTMTMKGTLCNSEVRHDTTVKVEIPVTFGALSVAEQGICTLSDPGLSISSVEPEDAPYHYMTSTDGINFTKVETVENPSVTTWYKVVSDAGKVCEASETNVAKVEVEDSIRYTLTADRRYYCEGDEVNFNYTLISGDVDSAKLYCNTCGNYVELKEGDFTSNPFSLDVYHAVVKGKFCPAVEKEVTLLDDKKPSLFLEMDNWGVCEKTPINITFMEGSTYSYDASTLKWWASTDGVNYSQIETDGTNLKPETKTWYKVTASSEMGLCPVGESNIVIANVEDSVRFDFTADKTVICEGDEVTFNYKSESENYGTAYLNETISLTNGKEYKFSPTETTTYTASVSGHFCPKVTKEIEVEVQHPATLAISTPTTSICVNTPIDITLTVENADATQWWSSTNGTSYAKLETDGTGLLPQIDTWYKVSAVGSEACSSSESNVIAVSVEDSVRFSITEPDALICKGTTINSEIKLTSGTPSSTIWNKNGSLLVSSATLTDEPIAASNTYEAVVTGTVCPAVSKSFDVAVEMPAIINKFAASSNLICEQGEVEITVDQMNATGLVWEKREGNGNFETLSEELTTSVSDKPTAKTFYRVRSTGSQVCQEAVSAIATVDVEDSVKVSLPEDFYVCPGNHVNLTAVVEGNPTSIDWTRDGETISSHSTTQSYVPTQTNTYHVTAVASQCPSAEAEVTVNLEDVPELTITASSDSLCEGDEVQLTAAFSNDTSITWYSGSEMLTKGTASLTEVPTATTTYRATAATEHGCPASSSTVKVNVSAKIDAATADTFVCEGESVALKATGSSAYKYAWYSDAAHSQLEASAAKMTVTPDETTTYYLVITNGSCSKELTSTVDVKSAPDITEIIDLEAREMQIVAEGGSGTYEYNYGGEWVADDLFTDFHYGKEYTIKVRDEYGCIGDTLFTTPTYDIKIPQYFTPNGDGISDVFEVPNLSKYPNSTIRIFDRFGKQLLKMKAEDYTGWDGTYNGYDMPSTDYWYEIDIEELDKTYTGHFTLVR